MNKLREYFQGERGRAAELARNTGYAAAFLREIALGARPCPVKLALRIEIHSGKRVTRMDLFPDDWKEIWPELAIDADAATADQPATQGVANV